MNRKRTYRAVLAMITLAAVLLGSMGFVIQSHQCSHSGVKVYALSGTHGMEEACCEHHSSSCCSHAGDSNNSCTMWFPDEEPCCQHENATLQLPVFSISDKSTEKDLPFIAETKGLRPVPESRINRAVSVIPCQNKHGGKEILLFNCQFLA
ncbi:MAG: hypothetical protein KFF49_02510 [Bacteroidales bacterium]|nr:hypothetical protein [Bacteroidales bacterium]